MTDALVLKSPGTYGGVPIFLGDLIHLDATNAVLSSGIVTVEDTQSSITWGPVDESHSPSISNEGGEPFLDFNGVTPNGFKNPAWNMLRGRDGISGYAAIKISSVQPASVASFIEIVDGVSMNTNSNRAARVRLNSTNIQLQLDFGPSASVVTISIPTIFDKFIVVTWGYSVAANLAYLSVNDTELTASLGGQGPFNSTGDKPINLFYRDDGSTSTLPQSMTGGLKLLSCFGKYHASTLRTEYRSQMIDRYAE